MLFSEVEKDFVAKVKGYIKQVEKNDKVILTKFLTLREQEIIHACCLPSQIKPTFFGGFEAAERKRCLLNNGFTSVNDKMYQVNGYKIDYNKRYLKISHPNVLGTLMSLQIDRSHFGDIVILDSDCYLFTTKEVHDILQLEFKIINKVPITLVPIDEPIDMDVVMESLEIMTSSMRIDSLISHVFRISRHEAQAFIKSSFVSRNFQVTTNQSAICQTNDVISVRKKGRFTVGEILRQTKSEKLVLEVLIPSK
jgi:RNA-binding protein YlmH